MSSAKAPDFSQDAQDLFLDQKEMVGRFYKLNHEDIEKVRQNRMFNSQSEVQLHDDSLRLSSSSDSDVAPPQPVTPKPSKKKKKKKKKKKRPERLEIPERSKSP